MKNEIAFTDIGALVVTCRADESLKEGGLVKFSGNGTVAPCESGDEFCGVAMKPRSGMVAVQFKGFVTVPCGEYIKLGWRSVAVGDGGIVNADSGVRVLVVSTGEDGTAEILL